MISKIGIASSFLLAVVGCASMGGMESGTYDVVVYGGTSAGVTAAVQAARMGASVVLIGPGRHLGGLSSGGLGATDIGNKQAIGGLAREFYQRIWKHYQAEAAWTREKREDYRFTQVWDKEGTWWKFEPHVAEQVFCDMIREAKVPVVFNERLDLEKGIGRQGARIRWIRMESGRRYKGRVFIDATYEGDLMAKAGVSYNVGREGNAQYGETFNGVQTERAKYHQFDRDIDPYVVPGDPSSGLLPGIHAGGPGEEGAGDHRVQAYNFRMCLTDVPENQVAFPKPEGYDPMRYELLLRYLQAGGGNVLGNHQLMPNRKSDTNNHGAFSTDNIGMNYAYPDAGHAARERIIREHEMYQKGLMWFLANDPRVPEKFRKVVGGWGLSRDEFADTGHWPRQLYVREARRMIGGYVMTEQNCRGTRVAEDPVALGAYGMDSHNTQRYVDAGGHARNEGDIQVHGFSPYGISYRSIVPGPEQCENLLVPVCLSASHIAFGSIRMEPVFMVLGHSAATAAVHALEEEVPVQRVNYQRLKERLIEDGQVLEWFGRLPGAKKVEDLEGIVVDDPEAKLGGEWLESQSVPAFVGAGYLHDEDNNKGGKSAVFEARLPEAGRYEVRIAYAPHANRAANVPVLIHHAEGSARRSVNQKLTPPIEELFLSLGVFSFTPERPAMVEITNEGTSGHVIVDAVQFLKN